MLGILPRIGQARSAEITYSCLLFVAVIVDNSLMLQVFEITQF